MRAALRAVLFGAPIHDFRTGMPAGSTYSRTGAATGLTLAGLLSSFAADVPQRTDRGACVEVARTNTILNSNAAGPGAGLTTTSLLAGGPDGTATASRIAKADATTPRYSVSGTTMTVTANTTYSIQRFFKYDGFDTTVSIETSSANNWGGANSIALFTVVASGITAGTTTNCTSTVTALANGWFRCAMVLTSGAAIVTPADPNILTRITGASGVSVLCWGFQVEAGSFATSPIPTTGAAATRGLPVFTEPVPLARTRALLTYADGTTTLVTGLTPGGTFDVASAVIDAGKGAFGVSELITRQWLA